MRQLSDYVDMIQYSYARSPFRAKAPLHIPKRTFQTRDAFEKVEMDAIDKIEKSENEIDNSNKDSAMNEK